MTAFNASINVIGIDVNSPEDGEGQVLEVELLTGLVIPSQQGPMPLPLGSLSFPLTKDIAEKFIKLLQEGAANLKAPSGLVTAQSLAQVDQAAKQMNKITGR